jgi:short-subunit dehydrogenase
MLTALIIGNTDGVGLALTRLLLADNFRVIGISRRASTLAAVENYAHYVLDVGAAEFRQSLRTLVDSLKDLDFCIYCAGIGEPLTPEGPNSQLPMFHVNLLGAVASAEVVVARFIAEGRGHFIGLSSQGDVLIDPRGAGYAASKAALTTYLEGLGLVCHELGVAVTNIRFGFVDTKMAKADVRPFMLSATAAAHHVRRCMQHKPIRSTFPRRLVPLLWLLRIRVAIVRCWRGCRLLRA